MDEQPKYQIIATGEATGILPVQDGKLKPITVIGTEPIRNTFDALCLQQAQNARSSPGVLDLVLNPDAHAGYGAPVGCVMVSPSHVYPGPVGVDIKCSMSLLQLDIPGSEIEARPVRRAIIDAICDRIPTGAGRGQRSVKRPRKIPTEIAKEAVTRGATPEICESFGIPAEWALRCEDAIHGGHDGTAGALANRLDYLVSKGAMSKLEEKLSQLGSYGGGNHFGECSVVELCDRPELKATADTFQLQDGKVAFLSHCGSRGFGYQLAKGQFSALERFFEKWSLPFPGGDKELVYAPLGSQEANEYLDDMALGANFATLNHLLINSLVLEAFQEVLPGAKGSLVYFISHNIARQELYDGKMCWVHRKGATRAFPGGHPGLKGTLFEKTGHPILLPGDPQRGSAVMVATPGAEKSCFSVNHGAGRAIGRREAFRRLDQAEVDRSFDAMDILTNCRKYPLDEAPEAYKDFAEVIRSVEQAELAQSVARLKARFVIKDSDESLKGAA